MIDAIQSRNLGTSIPYATGLRYVAWHQGGAVTLRVGKRHLAREADLLGRNRVTLCGRRWKASTEVAPNETWTSGDCARCLAAEATGT